MSPLMTREELSRFLNVSTRTVDRWRAMGVDLGEVQAHSHAAPRFNPSKVVQAVADGGFGTRRKARRTPSAVRIAQPPVALELTTPLDPPRHPQTQSGTNEGANGVKSSSSL